MPAIYRKTGGSWQTIKTVYRKTGGSWQSVKRVWRKTGGAWQLVFQQAVTPTIAQKVQISIANTTTQTKRLTGTLYRWTNSTSITYQFARSTNGVSYSNITGASGTSTNPAIGSSNTLDQYVLSQSDVTANTTNYYIYISKAVNSTFGTEQTSSSNPESVVTVEAPRDLSLTSSKTSSSITISWNNDTYSGRYEYQYKLSTSGTWNTSVFIAPGSGTTSFTITGLTASTNYDFRVRGWTGTSDGYGYYGNYATLTVQTNPIQAPNAPTGLYGDAIAKDSFFLGWSASTVDSTHDAADSYDYGVTTSNTTAPSTLITTGNPTPGQYRNKLIADTNRYELISPLSASTDYYGWVRAKNVGGSSSWSVSGKITTLALKPPNPVTNLTHVLASRTANSLKFSWTVPTTDSTHDAPNKYIYHTSITNSEPALASYNGYIDGGTATEITVSSLSANTLYYFWIRAGNNDGYSSVATSSGQTAAILNPPGTPVNATFGNASQSGAGFSWSAGTGGTPTGYKIALSTSTTEPTTENTFTYVDNYYDIGNTTSYRFVGLNANTTYYAWVKAYNADGTSGSVRRNVTTAAAPTITNPSWTAATNFQRTASTIRWGWNNGTVSPTTGTYTTITRQGFFWEYYTVATGGSPTSSGYKSYTTTNDTRVTVNSVNYPYLLYSGGSSPDVPYSTSSRYVRIQFEGTDYDFKSWTATWSARI